MPSLYAHYLLGKRSLAKMGAAQRERVERAPGAFMLGLQGPDFFFYGSVFRGNRTLTFGGALHKETGRALLRRFVPQTPLSAPLDPGLRA